MFKIMEVTPVCPASSLPSSDTQTTLVRPGGARDCSDRANNYVIHFNLLFHSWHVQSAPLRIFKALWLPPTWLTPGDLPVHLKGSQVCFLSDCQWQTMQYTVKLACWLNQGWYIPVNWTVASCAWEKMYKVYYMKWNEMEFAPQKRVVFNIPISFGPENSSGEGVEGPSVGSPLRSRSADN